MTPIYVQSSFQGLCCVCVCVSYTTTSHRSHRISSQDHRTESGSSFFSPIFSMNCGATSCSWVSCVSIIFRPSETNTFVERVSGCEARGQPRGGMESRLCLLTACCCQLCYHGTSHSACHHFSTVAPLFTRLWPRRRESVKWRFGVSFVSPIHLFPTEILRFFSLCLVW